MRVRSTGGESMGAWRWLLLVGLVLLIGSGTWLLLGRATRGAEVANVLALPVAVVGLGVSVLGLRPRRHDTGSIAEAARDVATTVRRQELAARAQLLGESGDPQPAELAYAQSHGAWWRTDGGSQHGTLSGIANYYRSLDRGRLLILGDAGAGKTTLAIQLILDLLPVDVGIVSNHQPVPVRLSLSTFHPWPGSDDAGLAEVDGQDVARRMDLWIVEHLCRTFGLSPSTARLLVDRGHVVPVLDGLDEMDPSTGPSLRAAAVIRALNHQAAARPFVMTCRSSRFSELSSTAGVRGPTSGLSGHGCVVQDATVVVVEPLTPGQVRDYLIYRFGASAGRRGVARGWEPILRHLETAGDNSPADPVVDGLCSPLRLFLAVTGYRDRNPNDLLTARSAKALDEHLFAALIPAAVRHTPPFGGERFNTDQVRRWLTTLALHLDQQGSLGGSGTDLFIHLLWRAAGGRSPRVLTATALTTIGAVALLLGVWVPFFSVTTLPSAADWLAGGSGLILLTGVTVRTSQNAVRLRRASVDYVRTRKGRRRLARSLASAIAGGLGYGLGYGVLAGSPIHGLVYGISAGTLLGLALGLADRPAAVSTPRALIRQGLTHDVAVGLASSVALGGAVALSFGPVYGMLISLTYGLALGFVSAVAATRSPWPRYLIATAMLARRGYLPYRPARFIDWALAAGLLRMAGTAVQFRHSEMQAWLVAARQPTSIQGAGRD